MTPAHRRRALLHAFRHWLTAGSPTELDAAIIRLLAIQNRNTP